MKIITSKKMPNYVVIGQKKFLKNYEVPRNKMGTFSNILSGHEHFFDAVRFGSDVPIYPGPVVTEHFNFRETF